MIKKLTVLSVFAAIVGSAPLHAQSPASDSAGFLGQHYLEAEIGLVDVNHSSTEIYAIGARANAPVIANLDIGFEYAYSWLESASDFSANDLSVDLTGYFTSGPVKPFATASLGYVWVEEDDYTVWAAASGVEYSLDAQTSFVASVDYSDDFRDNEGTWAGTAGVRRWITSDVALKAEISWLEFGHVGYSVGVAWKF